MVSIKTVPIGIGAIQQFREELAAVLELDQIPAPPDRSRMPWYSQSVDSTYLTGKRVFIFADATHAIAAARIASKELGFQVVGLGSYCREQARAVRAAAQELGIEALISDDYLEVEAAMAAAAPELVLGTQMERHSAKRLGIPCAVISAPLHVQDVPARYAPQMGWEGANVIFDSWVHPLMMGLEEHLIGMFRHDFEFVEGHMSHKGQKAPTDKLIEEEAAVPATVSEAFSWTNSGRAELGRIPFFVRGKVKRNTETFAQERGISEITDEVLYEAKAHFTR